MIDDQERELRAALKRVAVQEPPVSLRARIRTIAGQPVRQHRESSGLRLVVVVAAAVVLAIGGLLALGGSQKWTTQPVATPGPLQSPVAPDPVTPAPTEVAFVDGLPVMTVSEAVTARDAGTLPDERAAIRGYWSFGSVRHSCNPRNEGVLALWCSDGEFGITELDEQIWVVALPGGQVTEASGPHLTPYLPQDVEGATLMMRHDQFINGQLYPPFPVVLLGHFNDPRAMDCSVELRQRCRDRFVVDRIVEWQWNAVATPGVTPTPTPFPSPWPSGLFEPSECSLIGDAPYSFLGWTTTKELGIPAEREGHVWAVVSRDPVDQFGDWVDGGNGHRYRQYARVICFRAEWETSGVFEYSFVSGSRERHWEDGVITHGTDPRPGESAR
jgi:hypothetical protein